MPEDPRFEGDPDDDFAGAPAVDSEGVTVEEKIAIEAIRKALGDVIHEAEAVREYARIFGRDVLRPAEQDMADATRLVTQGRLLYLNMYWGRGKALRRARDEMFKAGGKRVVGMWLSEQAIQQGMVSASTLRRWIQEGGQPMTDWMRLLQMTKDAIEADKPYPSVTAFLRACRDERKAAQDAPLPSEIEDHERDDPPQPGPPPIDPINVMDHEGPHVDPAPHVSGVLPMPLSELVRQLVRSSHDLLAIARRTLDNQAEVDRLGKELAELSKERVDYVRLVQLEEDVGALKRENEELREELLKQV